METSEKIKAFLDFFESNGRKRSPIDTKLHKCRLSRRRYKDIFEETDDIVQFFKDPSNKRTLEQLRQLLGKVRKVERYHENRTYIPRMKE